MPNAIKYSTGSENLSLKKGNFYIGTGDVGKGPTESTNYYNGITPPTNGYTIYLYKETGGPSMYTCSNDNQLISLTNIIANASYTTVSECLVYYKSQSDKMCVNRDYEPISTENLVFNIDPGYAPSYPRTGNSLLDVSKTANSGVMYNSVGFNESKSQGILVFDGTNDYVDFGNTQNNNITGDTTFVIWFDPSSFNSTYAILWEDAVDIYSINWRIQRNANNNQISFYDDIYVNSGPNYNTNTFQQLVVVCTFQPENPTGIGICSKPLMKFTSGNSMAFGRNKGSYEYFTGSIGITQIYNRSLSDSEVTQLYNAQVGRYTSEITPTPTPSITPTPTLTPGLAPTPTPSPLPIPTSQLEVYLDASNLSSYPGSGSTWYDLSGNGNNATLYNGPTFSEGTILFDGSNDYAQYTYDASAAMTIITIGYSRNSTWNNFAGLGSSRTNNGFIVHNDQGSLNVRYFVVSSAGAYTFIDYVYPVSVNVMRMYAMSTNGTNSHKRYLDGSLVGTNTTSLTRGTSLGTFGFLAKDSSLSRFNSVGIRAHLIYNRQLSDAEITQIYNYYFT